MTANQPKISRFILIPSFDAFFLCGVAPTFRIDSAVSNIVTVLLVFGEGELSYLSLIASSHIIGAIYSLFD